MEPDDAEDGELLEEAVSELVLDDGEDEGVDAAEDADRVGEGADGVEEPEPCCADGEKGPWA